MADEQQETGVTVTHLIEGTTRNPGRTNYPTATNISISDGHLVVGDGNRHLAVYAPAQWLRAERKVRPAT